MTAAIHIPPATWPTEAIPLFDRAVTVEYASLTRAGEPITVPVTPFLGEQSTTLDVSTGLTYPTKADRARRNPRVALLYADTVGSGLRDAPIVAVQGLAAVGEDLQGGTDRYVRSSSAKFPDTFRGMPDFMIRRMDWYFSRLWVHVTPTRILWWPHGDLDAAAEEWVDTAVEVPHAAALTAPQTSPAPAPRDWRPVVEPVIDRLRHQDLTTVDAAGFPLPVPVAHVQLVEEGVRLELAAGVAPLVSPGPASLTLHDHDDAFSWQHNVTLVGTLQLSPQPLLVVDRALDSIVIPRGRLRQMLAFRRFQRRYAPQLAAAAQRMGQPVPVIRPELLTRS